MTTTVDLTGLSADQTVNDLCYEILRRAGKPMHYRDIASLLLQVKPLKTKTPKDSVYSRMLTDQLKRFVRVRPGVFGLHDVSDKATLSSSASTGNQPERKVRIQLFPLCTEMALLLPILDGQPRAHLLGLFNQIAGLRGTPQEPQDWTAPDEWIPQRLSGTEQQLAMAIWKGSEGQVNPRHTRGHWYLAKGYDLLLEDQDEVLRLTEHGQDFVQHPSGDTIQLIDRQEGLIKLLSIVAERGPGRRGNFLPEWSHYLQAVSNFNSDSTFKDTLRRRLLNLVDRKLVARSGITYQITQSGLDYLERVGVDQPWFRLALPGQTPPDELPQLYDLANQQRQVVREQLKSLLLDMDPYQFEALIGRLLEEMGYQDVETTSPANDRGVDVVGNIEVGITAVREVVQAKRYRQNIHRPVLDALRGSLYRFNAVRGTIIATSGFSKGTRDAAFERGAPPITLIDGDKLIALLIEHELGVRKKAIEILELDEQALLSEGEESE